MAATGTEVAPAGREPPLPALADRMAGSRRFDVAAMPPEERRAVMAVVSGVPRLDGRAVNAFGAAGQRAASRHLDELMERTTAADAGVGGALLAELATGVKMLDLRGLKAEAEGKPATLSDRLAKLPWGVGQRFSAFERFRASRKQLLELFAKLERDGERDLAKLEAYDLVLDRMVDGVKEGLARMRLELAAGQVLLDRESRDFRADREAAVGRGDDLALVSLRDRAETINAFEERLLRLNVAYTKAMTEVPRTRMAQATARAEYRNVLDTLLFDVPEIKRRVITLAALRGSRLANAAAAARRDLNAKLDEAAMGELEAAYVGSKEASSGALGEIAAMSAVADRLVALVARGAEVDERNRVERERAHAALADLRADLTRGMVEATADAVRARG